MVMKAMGLSVNTSSDWDQMGDANQKKEQKFAALKSIERQLLAVLKNPNIAEMEQQLFPLLNTLTKGDGSVLLQNHLGDFGLELMLNPPVVIAPVETVSATGTVAAPVAPVVPVAIPGEGVIVSAHQLAQVFSGLSIIETSCARPAPDGLGKYAVNSGLLLFVTKEGGSRVKGGAMEFEFSDGKITRIAFQLSTYRDLEQDLVDHPDMGGCKIDPAFLVKLH
jgi:hypothetical protein